MCALLPPSRAPWLVRLAPANARALTPEEDAVGDPDDEADDDIDPTLPADLWFRS